MILVNLLPWREENIAIKKKKKVNWCRLIVGLLFVFLIAEHFYFKQKIQQLDSACQALKGAVHVQPLQTTTEPPGRTFNHLLQKSLKAIDCLAINRVRLQKISYEKNQMLLLGDYEQLHELLNSVNQCNHHAKYFVKVRTILPTHSFVFSVL